MTKMITTHIRAYPDIKNKLLQMSLKLSSIQCKRISAPEVLRRMINIPAIEDILVEDAKTKRRLI